MNSTSLYSQLLPHLKPFDGSNEHSIVVMDNASIHHVDGIVSMIEVGAMVIFLPPYPLSTLSNHSFLNMV